MGSFSLDMILARHDPGSRADPYERKIVFEGFVLK